MVNLLSMGERISLKRGVVYLAWTVEDGGFGFEETRLNLLLVKVKD